MATQIEAQTERERIMFAPLWKAIAISLLMISLIALVMIFLRSGRYRYENLGGILWRVDTLSGERCRIIRDAAQCGPIKSKSTSTSVSLSTSVSVSKALR